VSVAGGIAPRWRRDGKEIVFISADGMMMGAAADTSSCWRIASPKPLFEVDINTGDGHSYAVSNHGERFLIPVRESGVPLSPLTVTTNFLAGVVRQI
jgi:hypothetical protein